jgi:hypothetical protein
MTRFLINVIAVIFLIAIIALWLFPILIAYHENNYWLIFLYIIWWFPVTFITQIVFAVLETIDR